MQDSLAGAERMRKAGRRGNVVQPVVQHRQRPRVPHGPPGPGGHIRKHLPAMQPLHDEVRPIRAEHFWHRVASCSQVPHQGSLRGTGMRCPIPAQHSLSVEGIDIGGPAAADDLARKAGIACHAARHAAGRFGGSKPRWHGAAWGAVAASMRQRLVMR
jgi:hypothetical protein